MNYVRRQVDLARGDRVVGDCLADRVPRELN
jgi:hypothetical protein